MSLTTTICKPANHLDLVKRVIEGGERLSEIETEFLFDYFWHHPDASYQCCATLAVLKSRGETKEEVLGLSRVVAQKMKRLSLDVSRAIDVGGTGGGIPTFNISTTVAFVLAAAGCQVCKHGNFKVSSRSGSFDLLDALKIRTDLLALPAVATKLYQKLGVTFLATKSYHNHPTFLSEMRTSLGVGTALNVIGPLLNPACVPFQIVGVSNPKWFDTMAEVLIGQGRKAFMLVHGMEGMDELSPCGETMVLEYKGGLVRRYTLCPNDFGLDSLSVSHLEGGSPEDNARIFHDIIENRSKVRVQAILPMAAAAFFICGAVNNIHEGVKLARETVSSGAVVTLLSKLRGALDENAD